MIQDIRPSGSPFKRLFFALPASDAQRRDLAQWRRGLNLRSGKPVLKRPTSMSRCCSSAM